LVLSKIRGRWGGFETLEKWVTGAYAGHTAICLRDSDGKLWVGESGNENEEVMVLEDDIMMTFYSFFILYDYKACQLFMQ
jgi:hypothetical protein